MNVAIMLPSLVVGGAEKVGNFFSDEGHRVLFFLFPDAKRSFFEVRGEIIKVPFLFPYTNNNTVDNLREVYFAAKSMKKLKKKYRIDVAISFMEGWNVINVCSRYKERVVVSVRTVLSERKAEVTGGSRMLFDERWIKFFYNRSDAVVGVSQYVCDDLINQYHVKKNKVIAIPNISRVRKESAQSMWTYGDKAIICVGRLDPVKQQERIIRAFSYAAKRDSETKLIILGDGKQLRYLEKTVCDMDIEKRVFFVGTSNAVGFFMDHARGFVMTSRVEGFPNVMVEAMAHGVPIITTDSPGGCGEIVGKTGTANEIQYCEYGILTPYICGRAPEDPKLEANELLLGEAICSLVEDDELYDKYSRASRERARHYNEDRIMGLWREVAGE